MQNIKTLFLVTATSIFLYGCSTTANLYPVSGPMSEIKPLPVITASVDGILGNTGNILLTLPSNEDCNGKWSSISPQFVSMTTSNANVSLNSGLNSAWAKAYGNSFTVGNKPGINKGEAMLTCSKGTVIQVEFYTGSGTANGTGVAKDSNKNIYKVLF